MNQNIKAAAEERWPDVRSGQLDQDTVLLFRRLFCDGATYFQESSGADEMAEALEYIRDDPQFDKFCLMCQSKARAALTNYKDESTPPEKTYSEEERLEYRSLLLNISMNAGLNKRWMDNIETLLAKYDK